jgi:hypothetical protein
MAIIEIHSGKEMATATHLLTRHFNNTSKNQ